MFIFLKKLIVVVVIVSVLLATVLYMLTYEGWHVPTYIEKTYGLGKSESQYFMKESNGAYSLEVITSQGKGEFLVKQNQDFSPYANKKVNVQGRYILENNKVQAVIEQIKLDEQK